MPAICRAYMTGDEARAAVERLLGAGVPGGDIRVLSGTPARDARDEPAGGFAEHSGDEVGAFAGGGTSPHEGMGSFAGRGERREGGFGDTDRETVTTWPEGVEHMRVTGHRGLKRMLLDAGLDEPTADRDVEALHDGRVLVLVTTSATAEAIGAALDAKD